MIKYVTAIVKKKSMFRIKWWYSTWGVEKNKAKK